jgi:hypothetical protein
MNFFVSVTDMLVLGLIIVSGLGYLLILLWSHVSLKLRKRRTAAQWKRVLTQK